MPSNLYLKTPKRYTAKGSRRPLLNLRWLWLYLLAPLIIVPAALAWNFRDDLRAIISPKVNDLFKPPPATATPPPTPGDCDKQLTAYLQTGAINKALDCLNAVAQQAPNQVLPFQLIATAYTLRSYGENKKLLSQAIDAAQQAINANPEIADGWVALAMALDWNGQPEQALGYMLHARSLDPKNQMLLVVNAEIYVDMKKYDAAAPLIDQAIDTIRSIKPTSSINRTALSHAHYVKAQLLEITATGQEAIDEFEQAWRVAISDPPDPTIPAGYIAQALGAAYRLMGQPDRAIDVLTKAAERDKDDPILQYWLGFIWLNKGDPNKARAYVDHCRDINPDEMRCLRMISQISFLYEKNYQRALEMLKRMFELGTKEPNDYLRAGLSYSFLNQCASAIPYLQQGYQYIAPDDGQTRSNFEDALRTCGSSSAQLGLDAAGAAATDAVAIEEPTLAATP